MQKIIKIFVFVFISAIFSDAFGQSEILKPSVIYTEKTSPISKIIQGNTYNNTVQKSSGPITYDQSTNTTNNQNFNSKTEITNVHNYYTIQEKEEKLEKNLNKESFEYFEQQIQKAELAIDKIILAKYDSIQNVSFEKSLGLVNKNIEILNKRNRDDLEKAYAYSIKAKIYASENLVDSALVAVKLCEQLIESSKQNDTRKLAVVYSNLADNYLSIDSINKSLDYSQASLKLSQSFLAPNDSSIKSQYWRLAIIYYNKQDYNLSLEHINNSIAIIESQSEKGFFTKKLRANIYFKLKKYEKSLEDALDFRNQFTAEFDSSYLAEIDNLISFNLLNLNSYQKVYKYALEEKKIYESNKNKDALIDTYYILGNYYQKSNKIDSAIIFFNKIIEIRHDLNLYNNGRTIIDDYVILFEIFLSNKDFTNAEKIFNKIKYNDLDYEINKDWLFETETRLSFAKINLQEVQSLLLENRYNEAIKILESKLYLTEENTIEASVQYLTQFSINILLAISYFEIDKKNLSNIYLDKSYFLFEKLDKDKINTTAYNYFLQAILNLEYKKYSSLNQFDSAMISVERMIKTWNENFEDNYEYISGSYEMISDIYYNDLKNSDSAIFYLSKAIDIDINVNELNNNLFKERLLKRAEYYMMLNSFEKALKDLEFSSEIELNKMPNLYNLEYISEVNLLYQKLNMIEMFLKAECYYQLNKTEAFEKMFNAEFGNYFSIIAKEKEFRQNNKYELPSVENNFGLIPDKENFNSTINKSDTSLVSGTFGDPTDIVYETGTINDDFYFYEVIKDPLNSGFPYSTINRFNYTRFDTAMISNNGLSIDTTLKVGKIGSYTYNGAFIINLDSLQSTFLQHIFQKSIKNKDFNLSKSCLDLLLRFTNLEIEIDLAKFYYSVSNYEVALFHIENHISQNGTNIEFLTKEFPKLKKKKVFKELLERYSSTP